jgi:hypothetical protein
MQSGEFRNAVIANLSKDGFVQSYKTQLRLALHKHTSANRDFSYPVFQHSLRSELICNIIADYLKAYHYRGTLHVFIEESAYHSFPQSDVLRQIDLPSVDGTVLETLMRRKRRPKGSRSVASQTDTLSVAERLAIVELATRANRSAARSGDRQRMIAERLSELRSEKESQLQARLRHSFEAQRMLEVSRMKVDGSARFQNELNRKKAELEAQLSSRAGELRLAREQEEESTRMLQQELDRQLHNLRCGPKQQPEDALNLEALRRRCNLRLHSLLRDGQKLVKEREKIKSEYADEKAAYEATLRVLAEVRDRFASIQL